MRTARLAILTCISCLFSLTFIGQDNKDTAEADQAFEREGYHEAAQAYKKAYEKVDNINEKGRVLFQIGECYRLMANCGESTEWYEKAITAKYYKQDVDVHYVLAECLREQGKFDDAIVQYQKFKERGGDKSLANGRIEDCERAALYIDEPPTRYVVEPMVLLNSSTYDYAPAFASKKQDELVFSSSRQESSGSGIDPITGDGFMDLFTSSRDKKGKWSTPQPLNNTVNTPSNEGAAGFNKKASTMYFTRCVYTKKGNFACDIYMANKQGNDFGVADTLQILERNC